MTPPRRGAPAGRSPVSAVPRGGYETVPNATTLASTTAAVGFSRAPANTPNPLQQPATGQVLASLPFASAQVVGDVAGVRAWGFPLPSYTGWCDLSFYAQLTSALGSPDLWWYLTNGRTVPLAAQGSAALRTQLAALTTLYGSDGAGRVSSYENPGSPGGADNWPTQWNPRERVWLPPGQNDVFVLADGGAAGAGATAVVWWTAIASPATEAAIVAPS